MVAASKAFVRMDKMREASRLQGCRERATRTAFFLDSDDKELRRENPSPSDGGAM